MSYPYEPYKWWVNNVLPLVYDDSLSYYEVLSKLKYYVDGLVGDVNRLTQIVNTIEGVHDVETIIEMLEAINDEIGVLANLQTTDKSDIVSAINSVVYDLGLTKLEINNKYTKPASGIPESDLSAELQEKINEQIAQDKNYNNLNNKPKINHIEIEGDHEPGYYGLGTYTLPESGIPESQLANEVKIKLNESSDNSEKIDGIAGSLRDYIADRDYDVGELVYIDGILYRITKAVLTGGSLVVGNNIEQTTINGEFMSVSSDIEKLKIAIGAESYDMNSGEITTNDSTVYTLFFKYFYASADGEYLFIVSPNPNVTNCGYFINIYSENGDVAYTFSSGVDAQDYKNERRFTFTPSTSGNYYCGIKKNINSSSYPVVQTVKLQYTEAQSTESIVQMVSELLPLKDEIDGIESNVEINNTKVNAVSAGLAEFTEYANFPDNLVDPTDIYMDAIVRYQNGAYATGWPGYFCTGFIPVEAGKRYKANHGRNTCWYDSDHTFISSNHDDNIQTGVTAPEGASYIRINVNKDTDGINTGYLLYFTESNLYKTDYVFGFDLSEELNRKTESISMYQIKGIQYPGNLIDPSAITDGYYVRWQDGTIRALAGYFCTDYIPVTAGTVYKANHGRNGAWYNSNKVYISGLQSTVIQEGAVAPENAAYMRFSVNYSSDGITDGYQLYCTDIDHYSTDVEIFGLTLPDAWYVGKTINWCGDSIVDGADFDEEVCNAMHLNKLTTDGTDGGINGSTIALAGDGTNARNAICLRYAIMPDDADIIVISAGSNDFQYAWCPIGDINSTANTTFYGAMKNLCAGLVAKYPNKIICFTTPIKRAQPFSSGAGGEYTIDGVVTTPFSKNKYGKTLMDYCDIIKEVCGYYSIPVLDLNRESMLNPNITEQQSYFDDALTHPRQVGQKMMARRVCGWLAQLGYTIDGLN